MEKKLNFKVCGLPAKYFIPFFIIVMATVYLGFMPVVKIYSNDAGKYMATSFIMTIAYLMSSASDRCFFLKLRWSGSSGTGKRS